ncbi:MAG: GNAT family N-acetyltransferase [Arenicellales bacterium]|nr:GNAT family N-acetyltransferase [Arenicellales bacterium]
MTKWKIRPATVQDSVALSECIEDAYSVYASRVTDLPAVSEGISDDIKKQIVWVAEISQTIVGGIVLIPKKDFLVLANVAVHSKSSGLGLGRALIEVADRVCLERGLNEIRLSTHIDIPENVRLYKHLGWHETSRVGNKIHMRKFLDAKVASRSFAGDAPKGGGDKDKPGRRTTRG